MRRRGVGILPAVEGEKVGLGLVVVAG